MKRFAHLLILLIFIVMYQSACIESSVIGDDILKDDEIGVEYIDTSTIRAMSIDNDSLKVFPILNLVNSSFLLGQFDNEIIGVAKAEVYCDFKTANAAPEPEAVFDSIVMTLTVDTTSFYGRGHASYNIEVFELDELISQTEEDTFYSDKTFLSKSTVIGNEYFIPSLLDTITVIEPGEDTLKYTNQIRIKLDDEIGIRFLADSTILKDTLLFKEMFKGVVIKAIPDDNSMISINYAFSRVDLYYTVDTTLKRLSFFIDNMLSSFNHDYSGSEVIDYFDDSVKGEEQLFIQGMEGIKMEMDIVHLDFLKDKNINKAELVFYSESEEFEENEILPSRLILLNKEGNFYIDDYAESVLRQIPGVYNGYGEKVDIDGESVIEYSSNVTMYLKKLIRDEVYEMSLKVIPEFRLGNPGFVKFYGTQHTTLRPKLKITYTEKD